MATVRECELAFTQLAERLAAADPGVRRKAALDRTVSCTLRDLDTTFGARLHDGLLLDIAQVSTPDAQVRMTMDSDDLIDLVAGQLNLAAAWASGRVKVDARVFDLLKLRAIF